MTPKPKRTSGEANTELASQRPGNPVIGKKKNELIQNSVVQNDEFAVHRDILHRLCIGTDLELEYRR